MCILQYEFTQHNGVLTNMNNAKFYTACNTIISLLSYFFFSAFICPFSRSKPSDSPKSFIKSEKSRLEISHMVSFFCQSGFCVTTVPES